MKITTLFVAICVCWWDYGVVGQCPKDTLAVYEIHLETLWDRRDFPKHYPEFRPPASWSKLVGYSHNETFKIFGKNEKTSPALKRFVETGNSDYLDTKTQGSVGIFDSFFTKPIGRGVGQAKITFTATANHSKVSVVSKIMPSPDWFIGVDSYDLCPHGKWMEYIHFTLEPLDAGTDKGLTFTSPNWPTDPQEPIRVITSHYPNHPAGSFYYPELDSLPDLAQISISKVHEYERKERFDAADHSNLYSDFALQLNEIEHMGDKKKVRQRQKLKKEVLDRYKNQVEHVSSGNALPVVNKIEFDKHKQEEQALSENHVNHINHFENNRNSRTRPTTSLPYSQVTEPGIAAVTEQAHVAATTSTTTVKPQSKSGKPVGFRPHHRMRVHGHRKKIPTGDAMAVIDDILKNYQKEHKRKLRKQRRDQRRRRRKNFKTIRPPRDCRVSEWSEWSQCSKTCGIGEQTKTRTMTKRARRGGKPCPPLQETTWCGSARACQRDYFNWTF